MYNVVFDEITRIDLAKVAQQIEELICSADIETVTYYDEYGKECDIKNKKHTKSEAVLMLVKKFTEKYNIPFVIIGGDSQEEDLNMYTRNKGKIAEIGMDTVFIAPANIGELANNDRNVIIGDWENSDGIASSINKLTSRMIVREDGGIEL